MAQYIVGSAHQLTAVADNSVQSIITSIPYYKKRQYAGDQGIDWPEVSFKNPFTAETIIVPAVNAELGEEETAVQFIAHILLCLREMWRVLRDDGVLVLNIGDTFARSGYSVHENFKAKDLMLIPERIAMAAHADGWYIRNSIPWIKRSHMPEGPRDRISVSHETIYIMSKSPKYYFDVVGIRQPGADYVRPGGSTAYTAESGLVQGIGSKTLHQMSNDTGRHCRTMDIFDMSLAELAQQIADSAETVAKFMGNEQGAVVIDGEITALYVNPQRYAGAHYATFPVALAKLFVSATTPPVVCAQCGAPHYPVYEKEFVPQADIKNASSLPHSELSDDGKNNWSGQLRGTYRHDFAGLRPSCRCDAGTTKAVVLDPFAGSGTTGEACIELGRDFILNDICAQYVEEHCKPRTQRTMRLI